MIEHDESDEATSGSAPSESAPALIVALGASAGGLEALSTFFASAGELSGLSFVVITHQAPSPASLLPSLLARQTSLPTHEVVDGMPCERDHVYVAPPRRFVSIERGRFSLADASEHPGQLPINYFFRSLAHDQRDRAVGVVLSGTGSDGTLGLKEIKASLGLSIVQVAEDAGFTGMPISAVNGDSPDYVVPAAEIPRHIGEYQLRAQNLRAQRPEDAEVQLNSDALRKLFALLRQRTGHDFSWYKESTVRRRIERRMNLQRAETLPEYLTQLGTTPNELDQLFDELLI
ncbi:MAG TPA: chemotaxis protein CheB, partial [Polyangiales bacterium]|nr:chemotaxis protein CheB [Polyangiales bacterium]